MKNRLRRIIRHVLLAALRLRSQRYQPPYSGSLVIIAPHPDDEALGCAGLIHAHRSAGQPVSIIYITDGAASHPNHPRLNPTDLARIRRTEATHALHLLGVPSASLHFLDAADGTLGHLDAETTGQLITRIGRLLTSLNPATLCLPCRDDGSSEHIAAFNLIQDALQQAQLSPRLLEYPIWARWSPLRLLTPGIKSRQVWRLKFPQAHTLKRTALAAYVSQIEPTPPWTKPVLPKGFIACFDTAEEFFFERRADTSSWSPIPLTTPPSSQSLRI